MSTASPPPPSAAGPYSGSDGSAYTPDQNGSRSNRSSTGSAMPPDGARHIDDLRAEADRRARSVRDLPIGHLLNTANESARYAETLADFRRRDQAYIEYMLAMELISTTIPRHRDFVGLNSNRASSLYLLFKNAMNRVHSNGDRFDKIKEIIVNENRRNGILPRSRAPTPASASIGQHSRSASQQSSHLPSRRAATPSDELWLDAPANGPANATNPRPPGRPLSTDYTSSIGAMSSVSSRPKPPLRPKPEGLHGNPLELNERFARLRPGSPLSNTSIGNSSIDSNRSANSMLSQPPVDPLLRMPSPSDFTRVSSNGSMGPPSRPAGPRGMPKVPPKLPLDTQFAVQMPKPPSPTYSPARNMQTPAGINPPRSTARSTVGTSSRNNSIAVSSASSRAPGDYDSSSYFPKTNGTSVESHPRRKGSFGLPSEGREIAPDMLFDYMSMFKVLLIDVRKRQEFDEGHIDSMSTVCIEPLTLRRGMSDEELQESLILSPDNELSLFSRRDQFDIVVYYDQSTQTTGFLTKLTRSSEENALRILFDALWEVNSGKPLKRPPLLLIGGIEAWAELLGHAALRVSDTAATKALKAKTPTRKPVPAPSLAATLAMEKRRRREYNPLDPEEERKWFESARKESVLLESIPTEDEVEDQTDMDGDSNFYRTPEDFLRRYPAIPTEQESMVQAPARTDVHYPPAPHPSSQQPQPPAYPQSVAQPEFPSRPVRAAPRVSYSGAHERTVPHYSTHSRTQQLQPYVPPNEMPHNIRLSKTGLINFGVTCYMNATIQCLNATIPMTQIYRNDVFRHYVQRDNWRGSKGLMSEHYSNLVKHIWLGDVLACRPTTFRALCARFEPQWGIDQQQDAHEFLEFVLNLLHEDVNINWRNPPAHVLSSDEEKMREQMAKIFAAQVEWGRYVKRDKSAINDLFAGQHCSQLRCLKCGCTSTTYETFRTLSVEIPRSGTGDIYDCLRSYCREEKLSGGEKWQCPSCKKEREATKRITITRAPRYLVVNFKRFSASHSQSARKVHTPISFPLKGFDIGEFMIPVPTEQETALAAQASQNPKIIKGRFDDAMTPPYRYNAYAVMRHHGQTLTSGHYTALVRDPGRGCWRQFNDEKVVDFDPAMVPHDRRLQNEQAYIVFFERAL